MTTPSPFFTTSILLTGNTLEVDVHIATATLDALSGNGGLGGFNATVTYTAADVTGVTATGPAGWSNITNPTSGSIAIGAADLTEAITSIVTATNDVIEVLTFSLAPSITTLSGSVVVTDYNDEALNAFTDSTVMPLVACFATGTRIATSRGDIPVEALEVGDRVVLAAGGTRPIGWIGHRSVRPAGHPRPQQVMPIRITADAFGPGLPVRDLLVSADHAIFAEEVLIPAGALVNNTSIRREMVAEITWWHIELDRHDVILADGLPVESFLENGNRADFDGAAVMTLHPEFIGDEGTTEPCAPLRRQGPEVEAVRERLSASKIASEAA